MAQKRAQMNNLVFFLIGIPVVIGLILGVNMVYNSMACYAGVSLFRPISDFDITRFVDNRLELNVYPVYSGENVSYTLIVTNKGAVDSGLSLAGYEFNWSDQDTVYTLMGESSRLIPAGGSILFETGQFKYVPGKCNVTFIAYPGPVGSAATTPLGMQVGAWSHNTTNCTVAGEGTVNVSIRSMTFHNGIINSTVDFDGRGISHACPSALISFGTYSTDGTDDSVYNLGGCTQVLDTMAENWREDFNFRKEVVFSNPSGADLSLRGSACPTPQSNREGPYLSGEMCEAVAVNVSFSPGMVSNCSHLVVTGPENDKSIAYSVYSNSQVFAPLQNCTWARVEFPVRFNAGETSKTFYIYYNNVTPISEMDDNGLDRLHYTHDEIEKFYVKMPVEMYKWIDSSSSYDFQISSSAGHTENMLMRLCGAAPFNPCTEPGSECTQGQIFDSDKGQCIPCGGDNMQSCLSISRGISPGTREEMTAQCLADSSCNPCLANVGFNGKEASFIWKGRLASVGGNIDLCIHCGGSDSWSEDPACIPSSLNAIYGTFSGPCSSGFVPKGDACVRGPS